MLVLSRREGERILIGDDVKLTIVRTGANTVRVGIDAPGHVRIVREECDIDLPTEHPEGDKIAA